MTILKFRAASLQRLEINSEKKEMGPVCLKAENVKLEVFMIQLLESIRLFDTQLKKQWSFF